MRLYHPRHGLSLPPLLLILAGWLVSCTAPQATQPLLTVRVQADGQTQEVHLPAGSTVQQALDTAGINLGSLDRIDPAAYTILGKDGRVKVTRVTEEYEAIQVVVPFERQTLRNKSLPLGKENEVYLQNGKNGLQEITYRKVYEDGKEVSNNPIKTVMLNEPVPEIVMVGIQTPFVPAAIPGRMVYIRDGNAWMIEENTANRQAIITTGDLDGRILALSDDKNWLLYTRRAEDPSQINTLWAKNISDKESKAVDLKVSNVIQFADWVPGSDSKVVFSTVEPRETAPGWQANNDLNVLTFSQSGWTSKWDVILEANSGGVYGWWGSTFAWSPDQKTLAMARPDGIQIVNFLDGATAPLVDTIPLQTRGDWAWVPGISWAPDGKIIYTVDHVPPPGSLTPEESPLFDLSAVPLEGSPPIHIVPQTGMFTYPLVSPNQVQPDGSLGYQVAYLQASFPTQSETSRYRLGVMDQDGSNRQLLFPPVGESGITPQGNWGAWSPGPMPEGGQYALAVVYEGNLWLVDTVTGQRQQVTGDGLTSRIIWK